MEFKTKVWEQIVFKMILFYKTISQTLTDFSVGSTIRTIFESVSFEIEELYVAIKQAVETAIRESIYLTFGFERRPAIRSSTTLMATLYSPHEAFIIPKGTRFATAEGVTFATVTDVTVDVTDSSKNLLVICTTAGSLGNVPANSITNMVDYVAGIRSITNPEATTSGRNMESDANRKSRFVSYIHSLGKGTLEALHYGLSTIPEINSVAMYESLPGIVRIYISTINEEASAEVIQKAMDVIEQYRAAGIQILLSLINQIPTNVSLQVGLSNLEGSTTLQTQIQNGITNYLNSMPAGEDLLPNNIIGFVFSLNRSRIRNVEVLSPTDRIVVTPYSVIRAGTVSVTTYLEEDQ